MDYLIDQTLIYFFSFKNSNSDPTRISFDKNYMPLVEIKGFNALIENNPYLINPQIINKKHMKSLSKCQEMMTIKQEPN